MGSDKYSVNFGIKVLSTFMLCLLYFFVGWVLGEWIPGEASACRPPWKLFVKSYFDAADHGFTVGANEEHNRR